MSLLFAIKDRGDLSELPPATQIFLLSEGAAIHRALVIVEELGIADLLADGPQTSDELARSTSSHARSLYRVLRLMSSVGVFSEVEPGRFALTPLSECLRSGTAGSLRSWVKMSGRSFWFSAMTEALYSVKTGQPVFAPKTGAELFDYLAAHPEERDIFNTAMKDFGQAVSSAVIQAYDFSAFRSLVDVGGGNGAFITAILQANPELTGILCDLPHVAADARTSIARAGLADRCAIAGGDFFHSVPSGGDAYILRWIIHDWDHDRALAILGNCRSAMHAAARLLLVETVLPVGEEFHPGKVMDFSMLMFLGGQERTEAEYTALLEQAGFRIDRIVPTASSFSVIEAVAA
ncbi:MAG: hypothetical protein L0Y38_10165 [Methylococcaceae bacterium]|nr:hypothetical protein [Methylococcaceae bacterium]MCI0734169.1 hypothetical protein [Methylococcaceae bacterium]